MPNRDLIAGKQKSNIDENDDWWKGFLMIIFET
jgi:hypothetical protein